MHVSSTTSLQSRYQVLSDMTPHIFICTDSMYWTQLAAEVWKLKGRK